MVSADKEAPVLTMNTQHHHNTHGQGLPAQDVPKPASKKETTNELGPKQESTQNPANLSTGGPIGKHSGLLDSIHHLHTGDLVPRNYAPFPKKAKRIDEMQKANKMHLELMARNAEYAQQGDMGACTAKALEERIFRWLKNIRAPEDLMAVEQLSR